MRIVNIVLNSIWHDPRVRRTATSTFEAGYDITVLGEKDENFNIVEIKKLPFKTVILEAMDAKYYAPNNSKFKKFKREFIRYRNFIKECIKLKPDLIHANDLQALPIAVATSLKLKCKVVYDSHEISTENIGISDRKIIKFIFRIVEKILLNFVDQVVTVSLSSSKILKRMYGIREPLVLMNCVRLIDESKPLPNKSSKFEILYHGKFYEGRGYKTFIKTAGKYKGNKDLSFVLRGLGPLESELRKLANALDLGTILRFDPPVLVTDLAYYASSSHVGVVLTEPININFVNTLSNKIFEYLTAGIPVIMSDVPEHRQLNNKYNFGIVLEAVRPENLVEAINRLHSDQVLYEQLSLNARKAVAELNWDTQVKELFVIYENLVKI